MIICQLHLENHREAMEIAIVEGEVQVVAVEAVVEEEEDEVVVVVDLKKTTMDQEHHFVNPDGI